ncbi:cytochrome c [Akkermansiaceae bacterium]|nr:cytochrome c [Akkermansiaceae bacterium]
MQFQNPLVVLFAIAPMVAADPLSYDNLPLGSEEKPLVLRTYMPDPGLDPGYFAHHGKASKSPKYNPGTGMDVKGEYAPIKGLPAAIGVNHGPALSYAFDTIECRIAYAWQGGFIDMYPYWGDVQRGSRLSYNYVPHLVGILFYKADPMSEIRVDGKRMTDLGNPKFIGYDMEKGIPVFLFSRGGHDFRLKVGPETGTPLSYSFTLSSPQKIGLTYGAAPGEKATNILTHTLTGTSLASFQGFPRDMKLKEASIANGQLLFDSLGCSACHSIDGSLGHGPTLAGVYGGERIVEGQKDAVKADKEYIIESIKAPAAKTVKGFPPNYMPPYALKDLEYESLFLFIESIAKGE